jgi:hypothetical protein
MSDGYKGVECQNLEKDFEDLTKEIEDSQKQHKFEIECARLKRICMHQAPFPLNYIAHDKEHQDLAIMIGLCIDKGLFK